MRLGLLLVAGFLLSLVGARWLIYWGRKGAHLALPNHRSSHSAPTPTSGGISFIIVFWCWSLTLPHLFSMPGFDFWLLLILASLLGLVGFWDDRGSVSVKLRLSLQILAAVALLFALDSVPSIHYWNGRIDNELFLLPFYLVTLVWLLNLFNFMDGIDGIAAIEAICCLLGAALIMGTEALHWFQASMLVLASCVFGFLVWNWAPAKIFMGDVGSYFLGFMLGGFALLSAGQGWVSIWSWFILLAVFVVDATITLLLRALRREVLYQAHRQHAYQILARLWRSHARVSLLALLLNLLWLWPLAWVASEWPRWGLYALALAYTPLVLVRLRLGLEAHQSST